jgi:hypothetical protein
MDAFLFFLRTSLFGKLTELSCLRQAPWKGYAGGKQPFDWLQDLRTVFELLSVRNVERTGAVSNNEHVGISKTRGRYLF